MSHSLAEGTSRTVAAATAAALVAEVVDTVFAAITFWIRGAGSWKDVAADSLPVIVASVPFYSSAVAILALAYQERLALDASALLCAGSRRSTLVPALPRAASTG